MSGSISRRSFLEHFFIENHTEDECPAANKFVEETAAKASRKIYS